MRDHSWFLLLHSEKNIIFKRIVFAYFWERVLLFFLNLTCSDILAYLKKICYVCTCSRLNSMKSAWLLYVSHELESKFNVNVYGKNAYVFF